MFKQLPKVELHLHLDGCIPVQSAYEMLQESHKTDSYCRMSVEELEKRMVVDHPLNSQKELLTYFDIPTLVLQTEHHLERAYYELCKMKKEDHVCYCEVRFAPQLHVRNGLTIDEVMQSVLKGKKRGEEEFGILTNIIVAGLKNRSAVENIEMLETVKAYRNYGVVAVDCAGVEQDDTILEQQKFLLRARELGFFVTFHCGEILESLPDLIRMTHLIEPDRIAHGSTAVHSPELCEALAAHQIMLDLCPTSNIQAGLYRDYQEVPVKRLQKIGVPVSISTDDTVLSNVTLSEELGRASQYMDLTPEEIIQFNIQAIQHSFADDKTKNQILKTIHEFLKGEKK